MIERPKKLNIPQPKETQRFKIIVLGDAGVGKTQLLNQYCSSKFQNTYSSTIAVDYQTKTVPHGGKNAQQAGTIQLNFWDFSGHPEFYEVRNEFYRDADAILLVMDVSVKQSLHGLDMWIREANENGAEGIPVLVVGNKKDKQRSVSEQDGFTWASQRKFLYYEASAAENSGIESVFEGLIQQLTK